MSEKEQWWLKRRWKKNGRKCLPLIHKRGNENYAFKVRTALIRLSLRDWKGMSEVRDEKIMRRRRATCTVSWNGQVVALICLEATRRDGRRQSESLAISSSCRCAVVRTAGYYPNLAQVVLYPFVCVRVCVSMCVCMSFSVLQRRGSTQSLQRFHHKNLLRCLDFSKHFRCHLMWSPPSLCGKGRQFTRDDGFWPGRINEKLGTWSDTMWNL